MADEQNEFLERGMIPIKNSHSDHGIFDFFEPLGQGVARMMYSVVVERASHDGWIAWCGFALLATGRLLGGSLW